MLASAARTLKLGLYIEPWKGLIASIKVSLQGTVAYGKLSFRRFEDQCKKILRVRVQDPPDQHGKFLSSEQKLGLGLAHQTCNPVTVECRAGQMACGRFGSTYTEVGTLHRNLQSPHHMHETRPAMYEGSQERVI